MSKIAIFYQCDPEFRISQELKNYISEFNLEKRNIDTKNLVIQGHPLYTIGTGESPTDSFFPKIGVEWDIDEYDDQLGWNYKVRKLNPFLKAKIASYIQRGKYEQVSHYTFDEILGSTEKLIETFTRRFDSNLIITGWSSGGMTSKKENQFLYMAVQSILPFIQNVLANKYGVSLITNGNPSLNIVSNQSSDIRHGFEIPVKLSQIQTVYRLVDNESNLTPGYYKWQKVEKADIHLEKSRSILNFTPLKGKV